MSAPSGYAQATEAPATTYLRIGILALSEPWTDGAFVERSFRELEAKWPGLRIEFIRLPAEPLRDEIRQGRVDLLVANASFFAMDPTEQVQPLATLVSRRAPDTNQAVAATVIVRKDRTDLQSLQDLKGQSVAAQTEECLLALHFVEHEIANFDPKPESFFKHLRLDEPGHMKDIVTDVLNGKVDAGIVSGCYLEDLMTHGVALPYDQLRILNAQKHDGLACLHSTILYPGLMVAANFTLNQEDARKVSALLFSAPKDPRGGYYWSVSTNSSATESMLKSLKLGPYAYLREWTPHRVWQEYRAWVLAGGLLLVALLLYGLVLEGLVRRRTQLLKRAHARQKAMQAQARQTSDRLAAFERAGAVSQISSLLAHELKQPLESIQNLSHGTLRRLEDDNSVEETASALEKIREQSLRANAIIDRVRAYGKGHKHRQVVDVQSVVADAIKQFEMTQRAFSVALDASLAPVGNTLIDPLDLTIMVVNLLKNAWQAAQETSQPRLRLTLYLQDAHHYAIAITDNGPPLSAENFERLGVSPLQTSKQDGLGLGLLVVKGLVESYRGTLNFTQLSPQGLQAEFILPIETL